MSNNTNNSKDPAACNDVVCQKPNVSKCDRDLYRVCPSKLSKRELENLYFALFENNIELKKTLHSQTEKLKLLSTKLQRMTVLQRNAAGKEKDCCNSKVLVGEQKDIISDLKQANDQMAEKIRILNMRLCSAKQFLKKSSCHSVRCPKCGNCPVNWSGTAINARPSQASVKINSTASQYVPSEAPNPLSSQKDSNKQMRTVETETEWKDSDCTEKHCNENKCRTVMDELKQKIVNLQEELSNAHTEYSNRISRLESDVSSLQQENLSVRAQAAASEHRLQRAGEGRGEELHRARGTINDLEMLLSIERRKVKELETALKLAKRPSDVAKLIEKFNAAHENRQNVDATGKRVAVPVGPILSPTTHFSNETSTEQKYLQSPTPTYSKCDRISSPAETKSKDVSKSDDSGYADFNKSADAEDTKVESEQLSRMNREMMRKISELQAQVDTLRTKHYGEPQSIERLERDMDIFSNEKQMAVTILDDRPDTVMQIQEVGAKNYVSKPERDIDTSTPVKAAIQIAESKSKMAERKSVIAENKPATAENEPVIAEYKFATADNIPVIAEKNRLTAENNSLIAENITIISDSKPADRNLVKVDLHKSGIDECKAGKAPCNPEIVGCKPGVTECKPRLLQSYKADEPSTSARADADDFASWSEYMAKTTAEREEGFQRRLSGQEIDVTIDISVEKTINNVKRNDDDCRYQIPGPMPCDRSRENKKPCDKCRSCISKRVVCECKGFKLNAVESDKSSEKKTDVRTNDIKTPTSKSGQKLTIVEPNKNTTTPKDSGIIALKAKDSGKKCCDELVGCKSVDSLALHEKRLKNTSNHVEPSAAVEKASGIMIEEKTIEKDSKQEMRIYDSSVNEIVLDELAKVKKASNTSFYSRGDVAGVTPAQSPVSEVTSWKNELADTSAKDVEVGNVREEGAVEKFEQCQSRVSVCRCPRAARREVSVFRTCSGTLRLDTSDVGQFRQCNRCSYGSAERTNEDNILPANDQDRNPPDPPKIISTTSYKDVLPSGGTSLPRELGVIQISQTDNKPVEIVEKVVSNPTSITRFEGATATRRDSATYTASPPAKRDSATYTGPPGLRRDSATYTEAPGLRRDSATYTEAPGLRRDSATYTEAPGLRRDSATYTGPPGLRRDSATYTEAPGLRRDSATYTGPPGLRRDSATYTEAPGLRRDSATYTEAPGLRRDSATFTTSPPDRRGSTGFTPIIRRNSSTFPVNPPPGRRDSATYTQQPLKKNLTNPSEVREDCECKCSRATSPDDTEKEISSLSDLPPEKEDRSPPYSQRKSMRGCAVSPGELLPQEDPVPTGSDTESSPRAAPLSAGEIPIPTQTRVRKLSIGEKPPSSAGRLSVSSEHAMEATLAAISAELAHCRRMLHTARTQPIGPSKESLAAGSVTSLAHREKVHKLHAANNSRQLADTAPHTAVFTLHLGTLVLSDEAVAKFGEASLCLSWQFWQQAGAMCRLRAARVVPFHLSTQYEVAFTDNFVNYMKQEEMPLTLCDMSRPDESIARCSLPVRTALHCTNRRVYMSLALMACPTMHTCPGGVPAGGELGALDVWCELHMHTHIVQSSNVELSEMSLAPRSRGEYPSDQDLPATKLSATKDSRTYLDRCRKQRGHAATKFTQEEVSEYPEEYKSQKRVNSLNSLGPLDPSLRKIRRDFESKWRPSFGLPLEGSSGTVADDVKKDVPPSWSRYNKLEDETSQAQSSIGSLKTAAEKHQTQKQAAINAKEISIVPESLQDLIKTERKISTAASLSKQVGRMRRVPFGHNSREDDPDPAVTKKYTDTFHKYNTNTSGMSRLPEASKKTVTYTDDRTRILTPAKDSLDESPQSIDITVLWVALNEECEAMLNPQVQRLYVAYTFLGWSGADLETPVSLPKPKHYADKCYFNFKKTLQLHDADLPLLGHMSRCRAGRAPPDPRDCIVFSVVSEPPEDPLGLSCCEDIGHAYLYLGDILAYSAGGAGYTEVLPVRAVSTRQGRSITPGYEAYSTAPYLTPGGVCGVLAVRVDGLDILRRCMSLSHSNRDLPDNYI